MKKIRVFIFGAGNVGSHLISAFGKHPDKVEIAGVYNRTISKIKPLENKFFITVKTKNLPPADVYIMALKDDVLKDFSRETGDLPGLTVHTSGVMPADVLSQSRRGVFYPLQTFTRGREVDWKQIPILINARNKQDELLLKKLGSVISGQVMNITDEQRAVLHVAAVFASNFSMFMYQIAEKITGEAGLPFYILKPLIAETAGKIRRMPPADALTGPARRNDRKTIDEHLAYLQEHFPEYADIYKKISELIIKKYRS